jgi:hypothetical protein
MTFPFTRERLTSKLKAYVNSDGRLIKEYDDTYLCKSPINLTNDGACSECGVLPGAPHPEWPFATARSIECTRNMTHVPFCAWNISIHYSTEAVVPADNSDTSPELRRVKRRTGTMEQQRFIIKDRNGILITDAAGSPFGGIPVTDRLGTYTFERDEDHNAGSMSQAAQYSGKLNSVTFAGCDPETLMLDVVGEEKWEGNYHFWTFSYVMTYDKDGWQPKPANAGLYYLAGGQRKRILEIDGTGLKGVQEPQPLSAAGAVIPVASRPAACNFITVDHYITFDFADLGFNAS